LNRLTYSTVGRPHSPTLSLDRVQTQILSKRCRRWGRLEPCHPSASFLPPLPQVNVTAGHRCATELLQSRKAVVENPEHML
jgi:hypothetical protein